MGINICMLNYRDIRKVHLELTTHCNARCPLCIRNFHGSDHNSGYPLTSLTLSDIQKIFPVDFVQQLDHIYCGGNFGDFIMAKDALDILNYFRTTKPTIKLSGSTNAGIRPAAFWEELARLDLEIHFCIDGVGESHSLYRIDTEYDTVIQNAKTFITAGGNAVWMMTKFDHNIDQIDTARKIAAELKFANLRLRDVGRNTGPAYTRSGQLMHFIGKPQGLEKITRDQALKATTKNVADYKYHNIVPATKFSCEVVYDASIYIDALGEVYPCCHIGHYPKTLDTNRIFGSDQITDMVREVKNNALECGIEQAVSWLVEVDNRFSIPTFEEGRLYRCHDHCGIDK